METLKAIHTRRSIRKYTGKNIGEDDLIKIINAGMMAPSAGNQQPWHFIVIDDLETKEKITLFHKHSKMILQAGAGIVVCADLKLEKYAGRWMLDCSAATQNMLLAAHDLGYGAVWIGIYPVPNRMKGISELIALPKNIIPLSIVSVGYADEEKPEEDRFKSERIHRNRWGNKFFRQ